MLYHRSVALHTAIPALDSMPQRVEAATLCDAARLGDVVLVRHLMVRMQQVYIDIDI